MMPQGAVYLNRIGFYFIIQRKTSWENGEQSLASDDLNPAKPDERKPDLTTFTGVSV